MAREQSFYNLLLGAAGKVASYSKAVHVASVPLAAGKDLLTLSCSISAGAEGRGEVCTHNLYTVPSTSTVCMQAYKQRKPA